MGRARSQNGGRQACFQIVTGKPTGKRPLGWPRCTWEDNIRMDIEEIDIKRGFGLIRLNIGIMAEPL